MSFEKPNSGELEIPLDNLQPVTEEGELELEKGERKVAEMVTEMVIREDELVDEVEIEAEVEMEEEPERQRGILSSIHKKAKGFVAAGIAAGALVGFSGTFSDAEAATRSRKAQVIQRVLTAGKSIHGEVERESQRRNRRELSEVKREISQAEREIKRIDRQIERLPEEGDKKETKALGDSAKNIDRAADLLRKADKAEKVGQKDIADSYRKLAARYQGEAGEDMATQVDSEAGIAELRQQRDMLVRDLTALRQEADKLEGKVDSSRLRERVVRRIPTRF
jgi:hypothetical protein